MNETFILPAIRVACKTDFPDLAKQLREALTSHRPQLLGKEERRHFLALIYLLRRKLIRRPRLERFPLPPTLPDLSPQPSWPKELAKSTTRTLRAKAKKFSQQVQSAHDRLFLTLSADINENAVAGMQGRIESDFDELVKWSKGVHGQAKAKIFKGWLNSVNQWHSECFQIRILHKPLLAAFERKIAAQKQKYSELLDLWQSKEPTRNRIVDNLERDIGDPIPLEYLSWDLLPGGELGMQRFLNMLAKKSGENASSGELSERFEFARSLEPERLYVGKGDFSGYLAFVYPWTKCVLLERTKYGNAAYVFRSDWERLSRMTKQTLRFHEWKMVCQVIHRVSWQWQSEIRRQLEKGRHD